MPRRNNQRKPGNIVTEIQKHLPLSVIPVVVIVTTTLLANILLTPLSFFFPVVGIIAIYAFFGYHTQQKGFAKIWEFFMINTLTSSFLTVLFVGFTKTTFANNNFSFTDTATVPFFFTVTVFIYFTTTSFGLFGLYLGSLAKKHKKGIK